MSKREELTQAAQAAPWSLQALQITKERERRETLSAVREAGNPTEYLRKQFPKVAEGSPPGLSETDLLAETRDFYAAAETRLGRCQRCPAVGGGCAQDRLLIPNGRVPVWTPKGLQTVSCMRWREYGVRRRLEASGVPELYRGCTFGGWEPRKDGDQVVSDHLVKFCQDVMGGRGPWILLTGPTQRGKTHLAAAVLRNIVRHRPRALLWFADLLIVRSRLRARYEDKTEPDPLRNVRAADVVVFDGVDPARWDAWMLERIEPLLYERMQAGRATLITSHQSKSELCKRLGSLTLLHEATECSLR